MSFRYDVVVNFLECHEKAVNLISELIANEEVLGVVRHEAGEE